MILVTKVTKGIKGTKDIRDTKGIKDIRDTKVTKGIKAIKAAVFARQKRLPFSPKAEAILLLRLTKAVGRRANLFRPRVSIRRVTRLK